MMNWFILILAGLCEVGFTFSLGKAGEAEGVSKMIWYAVFGMFLSLSMLLLVKAIETIPIGTAYAIWTGIGAVGTVLIGIIFFKESLDYKRLFFLTTLILSLIGLKYVSV